MYTLEIEDMDLEQIACSGQCFRFTKIKEDTWNIKALEKSVDLRQEGNQFTFSCSREEVESVWAEYFDLGTDYRGVKNLVDPEDPYLTQAILHGHGIRLLNQDLWEILVSFLISQNNNIPRIKKSVELLCEKFDKNGNFPRPAVLAEAGLSGLAGLGLGYRDKYVAALARSVADGALSLEELKELTYLNAHNRLMEQLGIGRKVADCACLFGLHHIDAFPVDTHIKKILDTHYPRGFDYERYRGYLGIIQQYMFYYDLNVKNRGYVKSGNESAETVGMRRKR